MNKRSRDDAMEHVDGFRTSGEKYGRGEKGPSRVTAMLLCCSLIRSGNAIAGLRELWSTSLPSSLLGTYVIFDTFIFKFMAFIRKGSSQRT